MYIREYMSTDVITVTSDTSIEEAERIMQEKGIRRLPVVDKGKLVGIVTRRTLRAAKPSVATSLSIWELNYLLAKLKVRDVMERHVFTVTPDDSIEWAVAEAHKRDIGTLVVVDKNERDKVVGIATTTDLYKVVTQILGFGQPGARLHISEPGKTGSVNEVFDIIMKHGVKIRSLVSATPPRVGQEQSMIRHEDCIVHLDTKDADPIVKELRERGYSVEEIFP